MRIEELVKAGLITEDRNPRQHGTVKLYLSPAGQEIANHIEAIIKCSGNLKTSKDDN